MSIKYTMPPDRPNPFVLCGKDLLHTMNGGTTVWYDNSTNVDETAAYPASNLSDGNRATFMELTGLGKKGSGFAQVRGNYTDNLSHMPHVMCIEADPEYPLSTLRFHRYDNGFSGTRYSIVPSYPNSFTSYLYGIAPKVDGEALAKYDANKEVGGIHGRYFCLFFDEPIPTDSPDLMLEITGCGRNEWGVDGSWDNGQWSSYVDETIGTVDPCPDSTGANDNYMQLDTTAGGGNVNNHGSVFYIRPTKEYMFGCYLDASITMSNGGEYNIKIGYYDRDGGSLGTQTLLRGTSEVTWSKVMIPVNYMDKSYGKRYSGYDDSLHEVPAGTFGVNIYWEVIADSSAAFKLRIDDAAFYDASIPFKPEEYIHQSINGYTYLFPSVLDVSGTIRMRRWSVYDYVAATSRAKNIKASSMDLGGLMPTNPSQVDYTVRGKTVVEDFYGNIASQFIPRAGLKRSMSYTWVLDKRGADFLQDMAGNGDPIGIIAPDGDWSDYVILNDVKISTLLTPSAKRRFSYNEITVPNEMYQAIVPVSEV